MAAPQQAMPTSPLLSQPVFLVDANGNLTTGLNGQPISIVGGLASGIGTLTSVSGTITASTQLLPANSSRKGVYIYNDSTAVLYLGFNATVTTSSYTLQIPSQGFFEMPTSPTYTGIIAGVWSAANGNARITEMS